MAEDKTTRFDTRAPVRWWRWRGPDLAAVAVVLALWSLVGLNAYWPIWSARQEAIAARDWPVVSGEVIESDLDTRFVQRGTRQAEVPDWRLGYRFEYAGRLWTGHRSASEALNVDQAIEHQSHYAVGTRVSVSVRVDDPEQSILHPASANAGRYPWPQTLWLLLWLAPNLALVVPGWAWMHRARARAASDYAPTEVLIERALHRFRLALADRAEQSEALATVYLADQWLRRPRTDEAFVVRAFAVTQRSADDAEFAESSRFWTLQLGATGVVFERYDNHADQVGASQSGRIEIHADRDGAGSRELADWLQSLCDIVPEHLRVSASFIRAGSQTAPPAHAIETARRLGARPPDRLQDAWWMRLLARFWRRSAADQRRD